MDTETFANDMGTFASRHIGPRAHERDTMLAVVGAADLDDLVAQSLPTAITETEPLQLPPPLTESQALARLRRLAAENRPGRAMIGLGYHGTVTPAVIRRNVLEDPAWYTAYTPYQPEISQGRLEALLNFQTLIADLTGLPIAGASLLDEATAVAEAMTLARRTTKTGTVPAARRRHPAADDRRGPDPGRGPRAGRRGGRGRSAGRHRGERPVRRGRPDPGGQRSPGRHRRAPRGRRRGSCQGRRGDRGLRPAGAHRGDAAGGVGGRHRGRVQPALRGAAVLRRPARRVHLRPGEAGALAARAAGRCLPGRARHAGVPARAADPGTAHPAGEGDLQHLHRPGAAGGHREHVRGVPRPARTGRHRRRGARRSVGAGRRPDGRWRRGGARRVLRHRAGPRAGTSRGRRPGGSGVRGAPAAGGRRPRGHLDRPGRDGGGPDRGPRRVPRRWRPDSDRAVATGGAAVRRRT